jgi:hypothetical protein
MPSKPSERTATPRSSRAGWLALAALLLAMWPAIAPAQDATPAATAPSSPMQELFGLVPAQLPGADDPATAIVSYVDIAQQLDAVGVEAPASMDDPGFDRWLAAARWLALPSDAASYLNSWRDDYGFDLLQVDQAIDIFAPPAHLTLYRGSFDSDAVVAALTDVGYRSVTVDGHALLSIRGDYAIDADAPTTFRMAGMNFGAVLPDGTLAFSSAGAPLAAVLDVAAGAAPSMLEQASVAMLIDQAPPDLVSAVIVDGSALQMGIPPSMTDVIGTPDVDVDAVATAAASEIAAASEMPPVAMALLGLTAGGPLYGDDVETPAGAPEARAVALLAMLDPASAEAAAPVVEGRLERDATASTRQPFAELFADWSVEALAGTPLLRVDLKLAEGTAPDILTRLLFNRDLGFLAW